MKKEPSKEAKEKAAEVVDKIHRKVDYWSRGVNNCLKKEIAAALDEFAADHLKNFAEKTDFDGIIADIIVNQSGKYIEEGKRQAFARLEQLLKKFGYLSIEAPVGVEGDHIQWNIPNRDTVYAKTLQAAVEKAEEEGK